MATSKQIEQPPPYTVIALAVTAVLCGAGLYFQWPVAPLAFIGVLVAASLSRNPVLTGPKDPQTQYPTVGNAGEQKALNRHRFWRTVPGKLFACGPLWPITTNMVIAVGAGLIAFTLPYEGAWRLFDLIDAIEAMVFLPWANGILVALLVAGFGSALRSRDPENGLMPPTEIVSFLKNATPGGNPKQFMALVSAVSTALLLGLGTSWWIVTADWYLIYPAPVTGAGLALIGFGAIAHAATVRENRRPWLEMCEARSTWAARWPSMPKLKEFPQLTHHKRLGENQEVWVDEFQAPAMQGAKFWTDKPVPDGIEPLMPANTMVAFLSVPDIAGDGSPITLSRSATRFRVITWNGDHPLDVTDPSVDRELLGLWLDLKVSASCAAAWGSMFSLIPLNEPDPLHVERDEWTGAETGAWRVEYGVTQGVNLEASMAECVSSARLALGPDVEVLPIGTSMYIGAITYETTELKDDTILAELEAEQESQAWERRWKDITGPGMQAPTYFPEHDASEHLDSRTVIEYRLFGAPAGLSVKDYFMKATPDRIQSGLKGASWSTATFYVDPHSKKRYPHLMQIMWSEQQIPLNPARISPGDSHRAAQWAITGAINAAFLGAKLPRPEVMSVKPLTSRQSRGHIWEVTIELLDGMTLADVRKNQSKLKSALEGCEWLRVGSHTRGCRIMFGAMPSSRRTWANPDAETAARKLDWEQFFIDSKIKNMREETPELLDVKPLPKNDLVREFRFKMPAGLAISDVRKETGKLMSTTGNGFLDIRQGTTPAEMIIQAAEESPMPSLALFDWGEVRESKAVPFATNIQGEPMAWDPLVDPHVVLLGASGSGKSAAIQSFLTPAAIQGYELHIFDKPKGAADFQYLVPYAKQVATEYVTIATALENVYKEVERRKELNQQYGASRVRNLPDEVRPPHMLVVIDEFTSTIKPELLDKITGDETEDQLREREFAVRTNQYKGRIGAAVGKIMREARSAGVSMMVAGQTLSADEMKASPALGNIKNQAAVILLGKASFGQRASAFKNVELAPELGENVPKGRGIFESSEGAPAMFQAWYGANFADFETGPEAEAAHLSIMVEQINSVRSPELTQLFDDDLRPDEAEIRAFGEIIATGSEPDTAQEEVIDMGELDLDLSFDDLEFELGGADQDSAAGIAAQEPTDSVPAPPEEALISPFQAEPSDHTLAGWLEGNAQPAEQRDPTPEEPAPQSGEGLAPKLPSDFSFDIDSAQRLHDDTESVVDSTPQSSVEQRASDLDDDGIFARRTFSQPAIRPSMADDLFG